jgi:hypothetical protein
MENSVLTLDELKLPEDFIFKPVLEVEGPTCTICSDCCLCETGGV